MRLAGNIFLKLVQQWLLCLGFCGCFTLTEEELWLLALPFWWKQPSFINFLFFTAFRRWHFSRFFQNNLYLSGYEHFSVFLENRRDHFFDFLLVDFWLKNVSPKNQKWSFGRCWADSQLQTKHNTPPPSLCPAKQQRSSLSSSRNYQRSTSLCLCACVQISNLLIDSILCVQANPFHNHLCHHGWWSKHSKAPNHQVDYSSFVDLTTVV